MISAPMAGVICTALLTLVVPASIGALFGLGYSQPAPNRLGFGLTALAPSSAQWHREQIRLAQRGRKLVRLWLYGGITVGLIAAGSTALAGWNIFS